MAERPTSGFNRSDMELTDLVVRETDEEVRIFFHPASYSPNVKQITDALNDLVYRRVCIGGDHSLLNDGEVRVFFNPLTCTMSNRQYAATEMIKAITAPNSNTEINF